MKKLLVGLLALGSLSTFAGLGQMSDMLEAKGCKRQLRKSLRAEGIGRASITYLHHLDTSPLIHVFEVIKGRHSEHVQMVKFRGSKCRKYN